MKKLNHPILDRALALRREFAKGRDTDTGSGRRSARARVMRAVEYTNPTLDYIGRIFRELRAAARNPKTFESLFPGRFDRLFNEVVDHVRFNS